MIPIKIHTSNSTNFLELSTRRLFTHSNSINCSKRLDDIYIKDITGNFWKFNLPNNFTMFTQQESVHRHFSMNMPKIAGFNRKLIHYSHVRPHRTTLLNILADQSDTLQQLSNFKTIGQGNIIEGMLSVVGDTINTIANGGEKIFDTIVTDVDKTINVVTNSSDEIIGSLSSDLSQLISHIGIPTIVYFIINLLTIIYVWYLRRIINVYLQAHSPPSPTIEPPLVHRDLKPTV